MRTHQRWSQDAPMPGLSPETLAQAIHQIGVLIWLGSLFFVRLVVLPATKSEKDPLIRMRFRIEAYRHMFRSGWVGLLLVWGSGLWRLGIPNPSQLPLQVQVRVMGGAAVSMVVLQLFGYLRLFLNMELAVDEERLVWAAMNNFWMRKLIWLSLALGLAATIAGASRPHLFR